MDSQASLKIVGAICVQNELPAGNPPWMAEKIGRFVSDRGNFSFIKDEASKECLIAAFKAVNEAKGWNYLKTFEPPADRGFMFCEPTPELIRINAAIYKYYDDHTGSTYAWTMRCMQFIAKNGWDAFKKKMS